MTERLIAEEHNRLQHLGYKKCQASLQKWFWWPKLGKEVKKCVQQCLVCKQIKDPVRKTLVPMGRKPIPEAPFQIVEFDHFGQLPRSTKGNVMILVILDVFSKFIILKPLRSGEGKLVAYTLEHEVFLKFGVPEYFG